MSQNYYQVTYIEPNSPSVQAISWHNLNSYGTCISNTMAHDHDLDMGMGTVPSFSKHLYCVKCSLGKTWKYKHSLILLDKHKFNRK